MWEYFQGNKGIRSILPAAGDIEDGTRNVGSFVGQEPQNGRRDLFGLSAALHRDRRFHPVDASRLAPFGMQLRVDEPWAHGVYTNAFFSDFGSKAYGEGFDGAFTRRVIDVFSGRAV